MRRQRTHHTHVRGLFIVLVLGLSLASLCAVAGGRNQRFYVELPRHKAGTSRITPIIKVTAKKDKQVYDTVEVLPGEAGKLEYGIRVRGQCPAKHKVGTVVFLLNNGKGLATKTFRGFGSNRSIGPDHGQGWEYFGISLPFLLPRSPFSLTEMCNQEVRRRQGEARVRMLNDGLNFELPDAYKGTLSVFCHDRDVFGDISAVERYEANVDVPVTVRCMPTHYGSTKGPPPREGRHYDPSIAAVEVVPDPVATAGRRCPVYVNFRGRITAGEKSRYETFNTKYRFVGDHDYKSEWIPVSVKRGETRTVNGRRFIQPTDDPRGFKTPGGSEQTPIIHGWMLLEVLLPDDTVRSTKAAFTVDCNPKPLGVKMKENR